MGVAARQDLSRSGSNFVVWIGGGILSIELLLNWEPTMPSMVGKPRHQLFPAIPL